MPRAEAGRTIARKSDHDVGLLLHLVGQRHAGADVELSGNRGSGSDDIERRVAAVRRRGTSLVWAGLARIELREHELQRRALHDVTDEVAMRRGDAILLFQVNAAADFGGFLSYGGVIIAGKFPLLEQHPRPLFHGAALQHVRIKTLEEFGTQRLSAVPAACLLGSLA